MRAQTLLSILVLFSLLTSCNMPMSQTSATQPSGVERVSSDADAIGTAVELTAAAKLTEIAGSVTATFMPDPALTPTPTGCNPLVTATVNANVRSGPGTAYDIVGSLALGQTAAIVGRNDAYTWWYINYPSTGGYAWIAGSVVTASCVPSIVQVVAAPPLPTVEVVVADTTSNDSDDSDDAGESTSALPDLAANGMQAAPNPATQGQRVDIQVRVTNRGAAPSGSFTVQWWATHALVACDWTVSSLAAHASKALSCHYIYQGWNPAYQIKLVVDSGNTVVESNEGNNSQSDTLNVQDAP